MSSTSSAPHFPPGNSNRIPHHAPADDLGEPTSTDCGPTVVSPANSDADGNFFGVTGDALHKGNAAPRADRSCWSTFVLIVGGVALTILFLVYDQWAVLPGATVSFGSFEYFVLCWVGGSLSAIPHLITTPLDVVKCRMQVGECSSIREGFRAIFTEGTQSSGGGIGLLMSLAFRGWAPSTIGYGLQGGAKFCLYEFFKHRATMALSEEFTHNNRFAVFLFSAAIAELFADTFLAPWEAIKVKLQTVRTFQPVMRVVMPRTWAAEGFHGFFKGLPALWFRQIPYTIVKFITFEYTARATYHVLGIAVPSEASGSTVALVSIFSGFVAGAFCATASHPPDTIVSVLNQRQDGRETSGWMVVRQLSCGEMWKGLGARILMVGTVTAIQWLLYDGFRYRMGMPTTGRK